MSNQINDNPTEWQPKWGEEVIGVWDKEPIKGFYGCENPLRSGLHCLFDEDGDIFISKHIRPIPPKPKTLREEVFDWLKQQGCSLTCDSKIKLRTIIDRHEKGGVDE
jgi:hypothetical protein